MGKPVVASRLPTGRAGTSATTRSSTYEPGDARPRCAPRSSGSSTTRPSGSAGWTRTAVGRGRLSWDREADALRRPHRGASPRTGCPRPAGRGHRNRPTERGGRRDHGPVDRRSLGLGYVGLPLAISFVEAGLRGRRRRRERGPGRRAPRRPLADRRHRRRAAGGGARRGLPVRPTGRRGPRPSRRHLRLRPDADQPGEGSRPRAGPARPRTLIARELRAGQLVVLQSTTFPGTTTGPFRAGLESSGLVAGRDFDLAFAPERVNPGDPASAVQDGPPARRRPDPGRDDARRDAPADDQRTTSSS